MPHLVQHSSSTYSSVQRQHQGDTRSPNSIIPFITNYTPGLHSQFTQPISFQMCLVHKCRWSLHVCLVQCAEPGPHQPSNICSSRWSQPIAHRPPPGTKAGHRRRLPPIASNGVNIHLHRLTPSALQCFPVATFPNPFRKQETQLGRILPKLPVASGPFHLPPIHHEQRQPHLVTLQPTSQEAHGHPALK